LHARINSTWIDESYDPESTEQTQNPTINGPMFQKEETEEFHLVLYHLYYHCLILSYKELGYHMIRKGIFDFDL
jgi:hypothetical protein